MTDPAVAFSPPALTHAVGRAAAAPLRLLALVQKARDLAPNQRFRHEQWAPYLERDHGISLEFSPFESPELTELLYARAPLVAKARLVARDAARRWAQRTRARDFDGVVILRESSLLGGAWIERWLAAQRIPYIYDFDDVIWRLDPKGPNGVMPIVRMPWKVGTSARLAAAVTVGNDYLAAYARRFNADVTIVRTSIEPDRYPAMPMPAEQPFTVVWSGSHSTLRYLDEIRPALEALARRVALRVRVVCDVAPAPIAGAELEFVPWTAAGEARALAAGHVGIMPLPDTPGTRGKCGCKALQYLAVGRPAVVSPVAINREIVRDGVNGLWATTLDDWTTQLERLARDRTLLARLASAGRATVLEGFTAADSAATFAAVARRTIVPRLTTRSR